jgi:outer membrane lipoprotein LolB
VQAGKIISALSVLFLLQQCSSVAPPATENVVWGAQRQLLESLDNWQLRGRVNVLYDNESYTPLWGTFNAGNTHINGRPGFVTMEQDGDILTASSPEELILQQLGYELPVSYLEYWIRGLPAPSSNAELIFNELNQLQGMVQDGWTVDYPDPRQYGELTLPRRVDVTRPLDDVRLRFVGLSWTLDQVTN